MKLILAALLLAFLPLAPFALKPECASQGIGCLSDCCSQVGGVMDGAECSYPPTRQAEFYSCVQTCRLYILQCEAPNSDCLPEFGVCSASCTGTAGEQQACRDECMGVGMSCAEAAGAGGSTGSTGGCCGAFVLLGLAGAGALAFARKA